MAMTPENKFIGRVHKKLLKAVYHMKNHNQYTGGVPDVWYSGNSGDLWVEYKYIPKLPVNVPVRPMALLSPLQAAWLKERYTQGRNVAVIIGAPKGGVILRRREWELDIPVITFKSLLISETDLAEWIRGQVEAQ